MSATPAYSALSHFAAGAPASAAGVLDTVEVTFRTLCRGPGPLALPGHLFATGRRRPVRLVEARELLLWPDRVAPDTRDQVWAELVRRAQTCRTGHRADQSDPAGPGSRGVRAVGAGPGAAAWVVGAAGMLVPGLRRVCGRLTTGWAGDRDDLEAEVLAGFLAALSAIDPASGRLPSRLCWAGYRAGLALRHRTTEDVRRRASGLETGLSAVTPPRPWGHPDFVLAAAVRAGTITAAEADLIGATRLEGVPLDDAAAGLAISRGTMLARRNRAERRLTTAIRTGELGNGDLNPAAAGATVAATATSSSGDQAISCGRAVNGGLEIPVSKCRTSSSPPQPGPSGASGTGYRAVE